MSGSQGLRTLTIVMLRYGAASFERTGADLEPRILDRKSVPGSRTEGVRASICLPAQKRRNFKLIVFLRSSRLRRQAAVFIKLRAARGIDLRVLAGEAARIRRRLTQFWLARLGWLQSGRLFLAA